MGRENWSIVAFAYMYGTEPKSIAETLKKHPVIGFKDIAMVKDEKDELITTEIRPILMLCSRCKLPQHEVVDTCEQCGKELEGWPSGKALVSKAKV